MFLFSSACDKTFMKKEHIVEGDLFTTDITIYIYLSCNCVILSTNKGSKKKFIVIIIKLFWYLIYTLYIYIYIRLKIKPNSVRIRFLSCQIFVLPSTGFELTPLIHCSTNRLALCPAP
jgi:hypothetical protein